jgi:hypothetical protein
MPGQGDNLKKGERIFPFERVMHLCVVVDGVPVPATFQSKGNAEKVANRVGGESYRRLGRPYMIRFP